MSICKKAPSFRESFLGVLDKFQEGDEAFDTQDTTVHYARAIKAYKAAVTYLEERCSTYYHTVTTDTGPYSDEDFKVHIEYRDFVCKLYTNLATAYFGLGQYMQSRKWSQLTLDEVILFDPDYEVASLLLVRSNYKLGRWNEAIRRMEILAEELPHLAPELEMLWEDKKRHKELQLETVRMLLAKSKDGNGQPLAMRYPADFEKVKTELSSQRLCDD